MPEHRWVRFAAFEADLHTRELRKHGVRVKLEDQPFQILAALLDRPGDVVTRAELQARLWPDGTFVDFEKSLTKAVNKLRAALGDSAATPRYVETLARRGYRFIAPVEAPSQASAGLPAPDPPGEVAPPDPVPPPAARRRRPRTAWTAGAAAAIALLAATFGMGNSRLTEWLRLVKGIHRMESLVVLPVHNLSGDPAEEYYADGFTDELIGRLARIASVRVISRTSAMHYKGSTKTVPEIARELGVDGVVEGSVTRADGRLHVNIKLIQAASERQIWAQSYDAGAGEASRLQGQIALEVAHQISARLTAETSEWVSARTEVTPAAYEHYLRGRYIFNQRRAGTIPDAAHHFELALKEDPRFALAWSGLADCHGIGSAAPIEPGPQLEYASKAAALDPNLAEARVSLGLAYMNHCRFADAERELKMGVQLSPGYVTAHQFYAICLLATGRPREALAENDRALSVDPFSWPVNNMRGFILISLRMYDRALEHYPVLAGINPGVHPPWEQTARVYWLLGRFPEALAAERQMARVTGSDILQRGLAEVEAAYAAGGFRAALLKNVQLRERAAAAVDAGGFLGFQMQIPLLYARLRERDKVLELIEGRLKTNPTYGITMLLKTAPELDFLRGDPRFQNLLRRAGLEP
jgi:TolB-like protein/DNA-binding winged helix-turn-helix (wHTH) protein/tetratricopeptide (TPR) repeat protein